MTCRCFEREGWATHKPNDVKDECRCALMRCAMWLSTNSCTNCNSASRAPDKGLKNTLVITPDATPRGLSLRHCQNTQKSCAAPRQRQIRDIRDIFCAAPRKGRYSVPHHGKDLFGVLTAKIQARSRERIGDYEKHQGSKLSDWMGHVKRPNIFASPIATPQSCEVCGFQAARDADAQRHL